MVYFDNAATSFPKPVAVLSELGRCVTEYCGNPGRSSHAMSLLAAEHIYRAREAIAGHFHAQAPEGVVFTYNATYALNLAIKSFVTEKCHLLVSDLEHNAVMRPIYRLCREIGVEYGVFSTEGDLKENIEREIRPDTRGIISTLASNVIGRSVSLPVLSEVARRHGLFLIVDASQAAGHRAIDISAAPCDALCAPGHKALFGIQGSGFVIFRDLKRRGGLVEGGSGSDSTNPDMPELLPEGYEAGTLATPAIATLARGVELIDEIGIEVIGARLDRLTLALAEAVSAVKGAGLLAASEGIVTFNYREVPSWVIASELDRRGICTRAGLHCAPSAHRIIGTADVGAVRASPSYLNRDGEIDKFYRALSEIATIY